MNAVVVGAQWGDEGKGKIVDMLSENYDIIARYSGGNNAGHTVVIGDQKVILHLIPSGILHPEKKNVLGNGMVINLAALNEELDGLAGIGVKFDNLYISNKAHIILPYHTAMEEIMEKQRNVGTTKRGIGPAYADKIDRVGVKLGDFFDDEHLYDTIEKRYGELKDLYGVDISVADMLSQQREDFYKICEKIGSDNIAETSFLLNEWLDERKSLLCEGAQGTQLDIDHGTYPYVTSSNSIAGGACTGLGIGPQVIDKVYGIAKAYTTRVGNGPFPTELLDETGDRIRECGKEYGASTGRPRRCGWEDLVVLRYAKRVNGLDSLILTKLDVLDRLDEVPVCVGYDLLGKEIDEIHEPFPADTRMLHDCKPIYEIMPGWGRIRGITNYNDLPGNAKLYVEFIENRVGLPISMISTGPERYETIIK